MRYFLILIVVLGVGISGYLWFTTQSNVPGEYTTTVSGEGDEPSKEPETGDAVQTYRNEEWGITFEYPNNWEIRKPAFYSSASLFNLAVESSIERKMPDPILINITPKEWIENAMVKMEHDGIVFTPAAVADFEAVRFESAYEGLPQIDYLVLVNDTYWINIAGKKEYEDVLNQVLESFRITPVEIPSQ